MDSLQDGAGSGNGIGQLVKIEPVEFFDALAIDRPDETQAIVIREPGAIVAGKKHGDRWRNLTPLTGRFCGAWAVSNSAGVKSRFFTPLTYTLPVGGGSGITERHGRSGDNARHTRVFFVDIDAGPAKHEKDPDGTYPDAAAARAAVGRFVQDTGLVPNFIVASGSGGLHLYFVLDDPIVAADWKCRAAQFKVFLKASGLNTDPSVTADPARVLRAPGSVHEGTGATVEAYRWRVAPYTLAEFERLIDYDPDAGATSSAGGDGLRAVPYAVLRGNITERELQRFADDPIADANLIAENCAATRHLRDQGGRVPEPHWRAVLGVLKFCKGGEKLAHEWSSGDKRYSEHETQAKLDHWSTGPTTCAHMADVSGKCDGCPHRGKITSPIQLGRAVQALANDDGQGAAADAPDWVRELNNQYALVRIGKGIVVADFQTPYPGAQGITYSMGYLDIVAARTRYAGRFAPPAKPGARPVPLLDAWLSHPQRRQYDGVVFSPGDAVPPNILNLWQGFAVAPQAGDVSLWLRLLGALVPDEATRAYVVRWLAWKVQNPGGVPDTVLIFTGGKGTGKNSLFVPLLTAFGRHGMLADDPELIAGRFTGHLMYCAFAVLDEAVFVGDPRQADRIKSRVTARHTIYEQKGLDPIHGINRCAYVMLTNHAHAWQATTDERRAVVIEVGDSLRGDHDFWTEYHAWANGPGPAALLRYLQGLDVSGFNPRAIPRNDALQRQIELTALRDPAVSWWRTCLEEGFVTWRDGSIQRRELLHEGRETEIARDALRRSFTDSAAGRSHSAGDWHVVGKKLNAWTGRRGARRRDSMGGIARFDVLPPLPTLREQFTAATGVSVQ